MLTPGAMTYGGAGGGDLVHARVSQEESSEILSLNVAESVNPTQAMQQTCNLASQSTKSPKTSPCRKRLAALSSILNENSAISHPGGPTIEVSTTDRKLRKYMHHAATPSQQLLIEQKMSDHYRQGSLLPPSEGARRDTDPQRESPSLLQDANSPSAAIEDNNAPTPASDTPAEAMQMVDPSPLNGTIEDNHNVSGGVYPSRFSLELKGEGSISGHEINNNTLPLQSSAEKSTSKHRRSRRERSSHSKSRELYIVPTLIGTSPVITDLAAKGTPSPIVNQEQQWQDAPQKKRVMPFIDQLAAEA